MVYTFWEGKMPDYIKLCLATWTVPHIVLDYDTVNNYTKLDVERLKRFTLPQQADCVRVHVLRDNGEYWLDADTIMINDKLPDTMMIGNTERRTNTIGYLYTEPYSKMFVEWAEYQDQIIKESITPTNWNLMGNSFTDKYVKENTNISICNVDKCWPETYMIKGDFSRTRKYQKFYFDKQYKLSDIEPTNMLMLHNSWTPKWYKELTTDEVLKQNCTMSNILREVIFT